jgi:hypothetical protein
MAQTKDKGLKMKFIHDKPSEIEAYSYVRKSFSGLVLMISGVLISWRLEGQSTVSLSRTESEYITVRKLYVKSNLFLKCWKS